ncbi:MAG: hypothetical protein AABY53_00815 [Bdellovibrionota bacterium]
MRLLILLISIHFSLISSSGYASTFSGIISKKKSQIVLIDDNNDEAYILVSNALVISNNLSKLSSGDYVSLDAAVSAKKYSLTVKAINYIGLKSLLGTWVGDDSYCYNFISFTEFVVSNLVGEKICASPTTSALTYTINPGSKTWTMLISNEVTSYVGDLKLKSPVSAQIELFNSETGVALKALNLKR